MCSRVWLQAYFADGNKVKFQYIYNNTIMTACYKT